MRVGSFTTSPKRNSARYCFIALLCCLLIAFVVLFLALLNGHAHFLALMKASSADEGSSPFGQAAAAATTSERDRVLRNSQLHGHRIRPIDWSAISFSPRKVFIGTGARATIGRMQKKFRAAKESVEENQEGGLQIASGMEAKHVALLGGQHKGDRVRRKVDVSMISVVAQNPDYFGEENEKPFVVAFFHVAHPFLTPSDFASMRQKMAKSFLSKFDTQEWLYSSNNDGSDITTKKHSALDKIVSRRLFAQEVVRYQKDSTFTYAVYELQRKSGLFSEFRSVVDSAPWRGNLCALLSDSDASTECASFLKGRLVHFEVLAFEAGDMVSGHVEKKGAMVAQFHFSVRVNNKSAGVDYTAASDDDVHSERDHQIFAFDSMRYPDALSSSTGRGNQLILYPANDGLIQHRMMMLSGGAAGDAGGSGEADVVRFVMRAVYGKGPSPKTPNLAQVDLKRKQKR